MSNRIWDLDMTFVASAAEMVPPPAPPFAYTVKERGWSKLLCARCAFDDPEMDYRVSDWYSGTPKPISLADAQGLMEGDSLTCDSCTTDVREVEPRPEPRL